MMQRLCGWMDGDQQCESLAAKDSWKFCYPHYLAFSRAKGFAPLPDPKISDISPEEVSRLWHERREEARLEAARQAVRDELRREQNKSASARRKTEMAIRRAELEKTGKVYYMAFEEDGLPIVKIGMTQGPVEVRFAAIVRSNLGSKHQPVPFGVLTHEVGYTDREKARHEEFEEFQVHGEYFLATHELMSHIESITATSDYIMEPGNLNLILPWLDRHSPSLRRSLVRRAVEVRQREIDSWLTM